MLEKPYKVTLFRNYFKDEKFNMTMSSSAAL